MDARGAWANGADRAMTRSWTALALGMLAAALHLPVSYALVKWSCAANQRTVLVLLALVALSVTAAGAWLAWSCQAHLRSRAEADGDALVARSLFIAQVALGTDAILALFIAASTVGPLVLSPCA
jgi:hypothetical protein